uniref:Os01g0778700 protein n=1 Tax=Macrostomum lignano TaxID=282301 RepID=A0A1I8FBT8_9PLAT
FQPHQNQQQHPLSPCALCWPAWSATCGLWAGDARPAAVARLWRREPALQRLSDFFNETDPSLDPGRLALSASVSASSAYSNSISEIRASAKSRHSWFALSILDCVSNCCRTRTGRSVRLTVQGLLPQSGLASDPPSVAGAVRLARGVRALRDCGLLADSTADEKRQILDHCCQVCRLGFCIVLSIHIGAWTALCNLFFVFFGVSFRVPMSH